MPSGVPYFIHRRRGPAGEGGREGGGPLPSLRLWLGGCVGGKGRIGEGEENRRRGMLLRRCEVKNSSKMVPYVRISHLQDEEDEGANAFMKSALWREDHDEGSRKKERKKERTWGFLVSLGVERAAERESTDVVQGKQALLI